ncbi:unnamed protein product [Prunus armeniaca]
MAQLPRPSPAEGLALRPETIFTKTAENPKHPCRTARSVQMYLGASKQYFVAKSLAQSFLDVDTRFAARLRRLPKAHVLVDSPRSSSISLTSSSSQPAPSSQK